MDKGQTIKHDGGRRSLLAAFLANLSIALAKIVAFLFTGSISMLAEAAHSVADTSKQGLLFLGRARARQKEDSLHPFGYGPERYFWALLVAVVLFPLGAAYAIFESVAQLHDPQSIENPLWAIITIVAAMIFEGISLRIAVGEARRVSEGETLWRYIRRTRNPDIASVLLEDAAAVIGLAIALIGIGLAMLTGDPRFDALGGIAIAILLLAIAGLLAIEMKSLLVGEAATPRILSTLRSTMGKEPQLRRLIYLRTLHLSPDELLVAAKIEFTPDLTFQGVVEAIDRIEARVYERLPNVRILHIEPDIYQPDRGSPPAWEKERA